MLVNSVKIRAMGHESEWTEIGYAFLVSLQAKSDNDANASKDTIGELLVAADEEGLTLIYERNKRTYEVKINLLGDSPQLTQEDVTPPKKLW